MSVAKVCWRRLTKCDTGQTLNPLMYVFLYITLAFSLGYTVFSGDPSVQASLLYQQSLEVSQGFVSVWGLIGLVVVALHGLGLLVRGKAGIRMMLAAAFGGFYMWLWAALAYFGEHLWFQLFVATVPNLLFWTWYAWQWYRRATHLGDSKFSAFV